MLVRKLPPVLSCKCTPDGLQVTCLFVQLHEPKISDSVEKMGSVIPKGVPNNVLVEQYYLYGTFFPHTF